MPAEGVPLQPKEHILTNEEVIRLSTLFAKHGINKVRLTGGEPTLRHGLTELVRKSEWLSRLKAELQAETGA